MDRKGYTTGALEKTASIFDLPADIVAGVPKIELVGMSQVRMENHKGILSYGTEEIHVSGGNLIVKIMGDGLELKAMNSRELLITGQVTGIALS